MLNTRWQIFLAYTNFAALYVEIKVFGLCFTHHLLLQCVARGFVWMRQNGMMAPARDFICNFPDWIRTSFRRRQLR